MTGYELETLLYTKIKEYINTSNFAFNGNVYKKGLRPTYDPNSSHVEDIVVGTITGDGKQMQRGTCVINVYVPDVQVESGRLLENKARCGEIEAWLRGVPAAFRNGEVYFKKAGMIVTLEEPATKEHFVSLKMDFKTIQEY